MPSTYSTLAIQLMATGENSTTWGNVTNLNLGTALEEAIVGTVDVPFTTADVTLSLANSNASQSVRNLRLNLTGTPASDFNLIIPATAGSPSAAFEKPYIINNTTGRTITVKHPTGTGVAVPTGKTMWVYANGTNVVDVVTHLSSVTLGTPLAVAQGGTGGNTSTGTGAVVLATSPVLVTPVLGVASATSVATGLGAVGTPSHTFTGDLNTGMWSPAADTIAFSEGGVEVMRITSAGDVGIGTTTPASKLAVYGGASGADTRVTVGNAASAMQFGVDPSNQPFLYGNAAFPMLFYTNTVERFRIGPAGQWGLAGANYGTSGQMLTSQGAASAPIWSSIDLSTGTVTGTLPVARGGLGITTTPSNGQIPIGNGTNYVAAAITAGAGISVTNGSGSITIATTNTPAGSVSMFAASTAPAGWLECNGALVSRTTFAALFAVIGTTYGAGDGSTTFAVPDMRGEFPRGWDNGRGVDSGRALGSAQAQSTQTHNHQWWDYTGLSGTTIDMFSPGSSTWDSSGNPVSNFGDPFTSDAYTSTTLSNASGETRPRNIALMFIIKT